MLVLIKISAYFCIEISLAMTGKVIHIASKQFNKLYFIAAKFRIKINGMTLVRHVIGSSIYNHDGGYASPSEYWKKEFEEEIIPFDKVCTSCMKEKQDFVVGHVETLKGKVFLYPVCDKCNKTFKNSKASKHLFYAYTDRLKPCPKDDV